MRAKGRDGVPKTSVLSPPHPLIPRLLVHPAIVAMAEDVRADPGREEAARRRRPSRRSPPPGGSRRTARRPRQPGRPVRVVQPRTVARPAADPRPQGGVQVSANRSVCLSPSCWLMSSSGVGDRTGSTRPAADWRAEAQRRGVVPSPARPTYCVTCG